MKFRSLILAAALAFPATSALASSARYEIEITGYVPVVCNVQAGASSMNLAGSTDVSFGSVNEFCNDPNGYQVWIDYAPGINNASVNVDGLRIPLSSTGSTMISSSGTAAHRVRQVSLSTGGNSQLTSVSMRIVPL